MCGQSRERSCNGDREALADHFNFAVKGGHNHFASIEWKNLIDMGTMIGPSIGALVITGLDEFLFKRFFETGHKLFFGLLLVIVIVWVPVGLLGKWMGKK